MIVDIYTVPAIDPILEPLEIIEPDNIDKSDIVADFILPKSPSPTSVDVPVAYRFLMPYPFPSKVPLYELPLNPIGFQLPISSPQTEDKSISAVNSAHDNVSLGTSVSVPFTTPANHSNSCALPIL